MPKIKQLSNHQLNDYLDAYESMLETDPQNDDYARKVKCIEVALHRRELIGFDIEDPSTKKAGIIKRLFSKLKRKK